LEKGLQWETTWLDLPSGEHKRPEYLAINPVGKVPALIDDGIIVHDSTIINEYLEDTRPQHPLLPRDPVKRARARAFEDYADAYLMPSLFKIFGQMRKPEEERDRAKIAEGEREARDHFAYLDRNFGGASTSPMSIASAISRSSRRWRISKGQGSRSRIILRTLTRGGSG
jgi:glutathione S-transferase